jgi:hypothetical protein
MGVNGISILVEEELTEEIAPQGAVVAKRPLIVARRRYRIAEGSFESVVLGRGRTVASVRGLLDALLRQKIDTIDRVCTLTEAQKQKLQLAGRGDIQRLFDRVEDVRAKFQQIELRVPDNAVDQVAEMRTLSTWSRPFAQEAEVLRVLIESAPFDAAPFDDGSLFVKTLRRQLTPEQAEKNERRAQPSHHSGDRAGK